MPKWVLGIKITRNYKPMVVVGQRVYIVGFHWLIRALVYGGDLYLVVAHGYFNGG